MLGRLRHVFANPWNVLGDSGIDSHSSALFMPKADDPVETVGHSRLCQREQGAPGVPGTAVPIASAHSTDLILLVVIPMKTFRVALPQTHFLQLFRCAWRQPTQNAQSHDCQLVRSVIVFAQLDCATTIHFRTQSYQRDVMFVRLRIIIPEIRINPFFPSLWKLEDGTKAKKRLKKTYIKMVFSIFHLIHILRVSKNLLSLANLKNSSILLCTLDQRFRSRPPILFSYKSQKFLPNNFMQVSCKTVSSARHLARSSCLL